MKPDFTGVWQTGQTLMTIEHHEPVLVQKVTVRAADGSERSLTFRYETGAEVVNSFNEVPVRTQTRWGDALQGPLVAIG